MGIYLKIIHWIYAPTPRHIASKWNVLASDPGSAHHSMFKSRNVSWQGKPFSTFPTGSDGIWYF